MTTLSSSTMKSSAEYSTSRVWQLVLGVGLRLDAAHDLPQIP
jgi:hypothetical protein